MSEVKRSNPNPLDLGYHNSKSVGTNQTPKLKPVDAKSTDTPTRPTGIQEEAKVEVLVE